MNLKHVVVVIVTYKTAELTIDCLRSIEAERSLGGCVITVAVVDTSMQDFAPIKQAIDSNGWSNWVQLICAPRNGGFAYGNNLGVRSAIAGSVSDYIHLLNPDTLVRKSGIVSLVEFLEANPAIGIAGSSFENLDGSDWPFAFRFPSIISEIEEGLQFGPISRLLRPWVVARTMSAFPQRIDWVPGASMMIRKSVFDLLGGMDENYFLYFEETDFCWRAYDRGYETWYVPQSRVMHIAGQSTKVTERDAKARRLPPYWFESRRRFFVQSYGLAYALATDLAAVLSRCGGAIKRALLRQANGSPRYISDLIRHSCFWLSNRRRIDAR